MGVRGFCDWVTVNNVGSTRVVQIVVVNDLEVTCGTLLDDSCPRGHRVKYHAVFYVSFSGKKGTVIIMVAPYFELYPIDRSFDFGMMGMRL